MADTNQRMSVLNLSKQLLQELSNNISDNYSSEDRTPYSAPQPGSAIETRVSLSLLFCTIGTLGIVGNFLVIYVILSDRKMRNSVTNLFIMNLALADFLIMVFGVPEIVQFMMDRGWLLGEPMCRVQRFVLVTSLYASVMTLVSVCVER